MFKDIINRIFFWKYVTQLEHKALIIEVNRLGTELIKLKMDLIREDVKKNLKGEDYVKVIETYRNGKLVSVHNIPDQIKAWDKKLKEDLFKRIDKGMQHTSDEWNKNKKLVSENG